MQHLALPVTLVGGGLAVVDQDGPADLRQALALLLSTIPGERRSEPDYGLPDLLFGLEIDLDRIADALSDHEPDRVDLLTNVLAVLGADALVELGLRPGLGETAGDETDTIEED